MRKRRSYERSVSRAQAAEWLERVDPAKQRSMSTAYARKHAADMNAGNWKDGVAVIAFDVKGRLINGQHVLNGLILSKLESIRVIVSLDHPPDAYAGFDKNRKRSAADDLKTMGIDKPKDVSGVATVLWQLYNRCFDGQSYAHVRGGESFPSSAETIESHQKHPNIGKHLFKNPFHGSGVSITALRAASYHLHQIDEKRAEKFFRSLLDGVEIPTRDHPLCVLRRIFQNPAKSEGHGAPKMSAGLTLALIFKAWILYTRGESVPPGQPLLRKNEPFPEIKAAAPVRSIREVG